MIVAAASAAAGLMPYRMVFRRFINSNRCRRIRIEIKFIYKNEPPIICASEPSGRKSHYATTSRKSIIIENQERVAYGYVGLW